MRITRRIEFDAGHRIPNHKSQCRHLHGHRYVLEVTLEGEVITTPGVSEEGMVMDFSDVKKVAMERIVAPWDHAFLVYRGDTPVREFLESLPGHKTVVLDFIPTAENLAAYAFRILDTAYVDVYGNKLRLAKVRLFETPNNWAEAVRGQS